MNLEYDILVGTFSLATVTCGILAYSFFQKRTTPGAKYFGLIAIVNAFWIIGCDIELQGLEMSTKLIGFKLQHLAAPFIAPLWYFGTLEIYTNGKRPKFLEILLFLIVPATHSILSLTFEQTGVMYFNPVIVSYTIFNLLDVEKSLLFNLFLFYSYALLITGIVFVLKLKTNISQNINRLKIILLLSAVFPFIFDLIDHYGSAKIFVIDFAPIALTITLSITAWAIRKYGLFELLPTAREIVIESLKDGVLVLNESDYIIDSNPSAELMLRKSNLFGHRLKDIFPAIRELKKRTGTEELNKNELQISGTTLEVNSSPIKDKHNRLVGSVLTFRDISARKQAEEALKNNERELRELNKTKDKLFSIISHDLRSPFQSICGYTDLLIEEYSNLSDKDKLNMLKNLSSTARNTLQLLDNLLQWSRVQGTKLKFHPIPLPLNFVVKNIVGTIEQQARIKKVSLVSNVPAFLFVYADLEMLGVILRNLITNGIKFTSSGGKVEIGAQQFDDWVEIYVQDNGTGMDENLVQNLFNVDKIISRQGTASETGTGLGLVVCREFVGIHGGRIKVKSIEGEGSVFSFTLPTEVQ